MLSPGFSFCWPIPSHSHAGKTRGKQFKHWSSLIILFLDEKMESPKMSKRMATVGSCDWTWPHLQVGFILVPWQVSVCGPSARWMMLGCWLHRSHPKTREGRRYGMIDMPCFSSQNQRPRSNSFCMFLFKAGAALDHSLGNARTWYKMKWKSNENSG